MTVSSSATHIMPLVPWMSVHHIGELNFCALVDSSRNNRICAHHTLIHY